MPESVSVNYPGRSFAILAEVTIETPKAKGVLFAHGGRFGRHVLYIKDSRLHYVYNWLGENEQKVSSSVEVPTGKCILGVRFRKEGTKEPLPLGPATLDIDDQPVGETQIITMLGNFSLTGEGLVDWPRWRSAGIERL